MTTDKEIYDDLAAKLSSKLGMPVVIDEGMPEGVWIVSRPANPSHDTDHKQDG